MRRSLRRSRLCSGACRRAGFLGTTSFSALASPSVVSGGGAPIRFVPPSVASGEFSAQYEVRIFETGEVQTRPDNCTIYSTRSCGSRFREPRRF